MFENSPSTYCIDNFKSIDVILDRFGQYEAISRAIDSFALGKWGVVKSSGWPPSEVPIECFGLVLFSHGTPNSQSYHLILTYAYQFQIIDAFNFVSTRTLIGSVATARTSIPTFGIDCVADLSR